MTDVKIKCSCGCGHTLYVSSFGNNMIAIGSEKNARKSSKTFTGVVISKKEIIRVIKNLKRT